MKRILTNNLFLKIISVIAAVLLWGVVINIDNPTDTFTISGIPIKVINEKAAITDNNLTYELPGENTVSVEVTARRQDRKKISADDFEATIDLNEIYGATSSVAVNMEVVNNKGLIRSWTQITRSVRVEVENMETRLFEIRVIPVGSLEDTYTFSQSTVSPGNVRVTAPESVMSRIDHAGIELDVSGATDNVQETGQIKLYTDEESRNELELSDPRVVLNVTEAEVTLGVVKTNQISVDIQVTGQDAVADGCKYINYTCDPQTILVTGPRSQIADLAKLTITEDLTGARENFSKVYDVKDYLPKGLEVAEGQPKTIEVTYQIDRLEQKSFYIGKNQIRLLGMSDELEYRFGEGEGITIVLTGLSEDMEQVVEKDITVTLDVEEYTQPGTYVCEPVVELPEEYRDYFQVSAGSVRLIVTSPESEESSTAESSSESGSPEEGTSSVEAGTDGTGENSSESVSATVPGREEFSEESSGEDE
jgi:YbbR domain-containing protein